MANELLDKKQPGIYNQALMDFGAVICKPKQPLCTTCFLKGKCIAYLKGSVNELPVKEKSILKKSRWFYFLIAEYNGKVYVRKRGPKDIWENLYEFILDETAEAISGDPVASLSSFKKIVGKIKYETIGVSEDFRQQLTHQTIHGRFVHISVKKPLQADGYKLVDARQLKKLPFPKLIATYLTENQEKPFER